MKKATILNGLLGILVLGLLTAGFTGCPQEATETPAPDPNPNPNPNPNPGPNGGDQLGEGVYLGIISFDIKTHEISGSSGPVNLMTGKNSLISALDNSYKKSADEGTTLYYAVHQALSTMKGMESRLPANTKHFNIITFTDGLDVGSTNAILWRNKPLDGQNFGGEDPDKYLTWVKDKLGSTTIKGLSVTASAYGVMGSDVKDQTKFKNDLEKLKTATGEARTDIPINELEKKFGEIASALDVTTTNTSFDLRVAGQGSGTKFKMTFDKVADESDSQIYFIGTYNYDAAGGSHTLKDLEYKGIQPGPLSIAGTEDGLKVNFHFDTLTLTNGKIVKDDVKQYIRKPNDAVWQPNVEFKPTDAIQENTIKSSAITYLVLDSSLSLSDSDVINIRDAAKKFIDALYDNYNKGSPNPGGQPSNPDPGVPLLSAPTNIEVNAITGGAHLSWSAVSGASGYKVYRSSSQSGSYTDVGSPSSTSYTDYGLSSGTYYYKVATVNSKGNVGSQSSAKAVTISSGSNPGGSLSPPNVSVGWTTSDTINLSWDPVSGAYDYIIYFSYSLGGNYQYLDKTQFTNFSDDIGLIPNTTYYYKVAAVSWEGEEVLSEAIEAATKPAEFYSGSE